MGGDGGAGGGSAGGGSEGGVGGADGGGESVQSVRTRFEHGALSKADAMRVQARRDHGFESRLAQNHHPVLYRTISKQPFSLAMHHGRESPSHTGMAQPVCGFLQLDAPGGARRQFQVSMHSQGCGGGDGGGEGGGGEGGGGEGGGGEGGGGKGGGGEGGNDGGSDGGGDGGSEGGLHGDFDGGADGGDDGGGGEGGGGEGGGDGGGGDGDARNSHTA